MKNLVYLLFLLVLGSCKNSVPTASSVAQNTVIDTVASVDGRELKTDTLTKVSDAFMLNKLLCYWNHHFVIYHYGNEEYGLDITMKLHDQKTKKLLLEWEFSPKYSEDYDYKSEYYFDSINKRHFRDMNFDGYKDFTIYSHGSMPMTSATNVVVFNHETKSFENSDLSDNVIEELDSVNRILTTSSWDMRANYTKKHHFDDKGKIKFTEVFTEVFEEEEVIGDSTVTKLRYQKIVDGKVVEQRID